MNVKEIKKGQLVWVAGQGPMRVKVLTSPPEKTTVTLLTPSGVRYYADPKQLVHPMTTEFMGSFVEEYEAHFGHSPELRLWQKELWEK